MKIIAVLTTFGEFIGRVDDDFALDTCPEIDETGAFTLDKPLKIVSMPTSQGMVNALLPPSQFLDSSKMPIPSETILLIGDAPAKPAEQYIQITSGIAVQKAAPGIIVGR